MAARKIVIFLSSVRPGRMADRVAEFVKQTVSAQGMTPVMLGMLLFFHFLNLIIVRLKLDSGGLFHAPCLLRTGFNTKQSFPNEVFFFPESFNVLFRE